ncbi:MAG TPA: O-methyltransferase [Solirubrobacteraceae bacterium]|nr:O-methyltransferase [Solirubrobacteraceae bacterium]
MSYSLWQEVDEYVEEQLIGPDAALDDALRASIAAGLPPIAVSPAQGKMLGLLARIHGARRILEIGTLGGYSTIWLGRALPAGGHLVTLELEPHYAAVAAENVERAGLADLVEVIVGPALASLDELIERGAEPFDLVFIDADKAATPDYFERSLRLVVPGAVVVSDNVVRGGALADAASDEPGALGMRRFHELLAEARTAGTVEATTIQTVGVKGHDGFTLAVVAS